MADYKFSFSEKDKFYNPAWMAPEGISISIIDRFIRVFVLIISFAYNRVKEKAGGD